MFRSLPRRKSKSSGNLRIGIPVPTGKFASPPLQKSPKSLGSRGGNSVVIARARARALNQQAPGAKRRSLASSSLSTQYSPMEIAKCTGLKVSGIPPSLNTKEMLTKHFKIYGNLTKVAPRTKQGYAIVEFDNHDSAKKAKLGGSILRPGTTPTRISWISPSSANLKALQSEPVPLFPVQQKPRAQEKPNLFAFSFSPKKQQEPEGSSSSIIHPKIDETKPQLSRAAVVQQLRLLVGQKCSTSFEKYQLMQNRDKILQKGRVKVSDVNRAASLRGTCPDMCPEKERYEREVQKRLSSFEMRPDGSVDHAVAVKDYSRSSADQDEPLPHELRPPGILAMTMDYLMGQVAFECPNKESQIPAWYDFLWNRTRGIRKDITQQMMTDQLAVDLVEKCARFHIYAAHRLCEMGIGDFDQKMNTENLTKCLQTLRHFYEDSEKAGVECYNEAEFRAYDVLLNLNDSNILRQVLSYKPFVQQSNQVRFAVKIFTTIQSNNYTGFFRLVQNKAEYLQACITHRYFTQVRETALRIMCRAYHTNSEFPVEELIRMLGFETQIEAVEFCQSYGLQTSRETGATILLNKHSFAYPRTAVGHKISNAIIEPKRGMLALGEVLNGGNPVSSVELPSPVVSFDSEGNYLYDPVIVPYLEESTAEFRHQQEEQRRNIEEEAERRRKAQVLENNIMTVASKILEEGIQEPLELAATKTSLDARSEYIFGNILEPMIRTVAAAAKIETEEQLELLARKKWQTAIISAVSKFSEEETENIVSHNCLEFVQEAARKELILARTEKKRGEIEISAEVIGRKLFQESVRVFVKEISEDVYREEITEKFEKLGRIKRRLEQIRVQKIFSQWRSLASRSKQKREIIATFPVFPSTSSLAESASGLRPLKRARLSLPEERDAFKRRMDDAGDKMDDWVKNSWEMAVETSELGKWGVEKLRVIRANLENCFLRRFFVRWRLETRESRLRMEFMRNFPISPSKMAVMNRDRVLSSLKREKSAGRVLGVGETSAIRESLDLIGEMMDASRREESFFVEESLIEGVRGKENGDGIVDFNGVSDIAGFIPPDSEGPNEKRLKRLSEDYLRTAEELKKKKSRRVSIPESQVVDILLAELNFELKNEERSLQKDEERWKSMINP